MRIERETLQALRASGQAAARAWSDGGLREAVDAIAAAACAPALQSPGTGTISPQAATHLGHAIGEALLETPASSRSALRLAAALLASPNPSQRMIGPHLLTPLARKSPECSNHILELADLCADAAAAAALAIPLAAAVSRDASAAAACLANIEDSPRRRLALRATIQALTAREPTLARKLQTRRAPPVTSSMESRTGRTRDHGSRAE